MPLTFYILDVFAEQKYAGNQLAVVRGAGGLTTEEMQQIAQEMNYSETTFILSDDMREGGFDVRIFTPVDEVPFAGHPTLGTAFICQQELLATPVEKVVLNLKVGPILVAINYKEDCPVELWMKQNQPAFGAKVAPEAMARALNLNVDELDNRYPIQEVSTGLLFIIVPIKTLASVKRAFVDTRALAELTRETEAKDILIFCSETYHEQNDLNVRVFVDYHGIPEDPATGSGNGCLAAYLVRYRYYSSPAIKLRVEQGYEMGRPSLLRLRAEERDGEFDLRVGGQVFLVAKGELL